MAPPGERALGLPLHRKRVDAQRRPPCVFDFLDFLGAQIGAIITLLGGGRGQGSFGSHANTVRAARP